MKEKDAITKLLKSATESVRKSARRKNIPLVVSKKGKVTIITPDQQERSFAKPARRLKKT